MSARKGHALLALKDAFTSILEVDYEPVFDIAVALVDSLFDLQGNPTIMQDMRDLIQTAQYVVANRALLRSDFAGHIYHQITGDVATRKGYATFYTKSPISSFLASLAVFYDNPQSQRNWADLSALRNTFRIIGVF
ncbi:MAG TPA: hypothetical protein VFE98_00300 [Candidatus Bathyarchaeia archaeon]|nr:hypothetical protein [Candidatus Bathyarchaeia archaeon]